MAFREVSVTQIPQVLRRWIRGDDGLRSIALGAGVDRKTARRYVEAAVALGLDRSGDEDQLTDELIGGICEAVRPGPPERPWCRLGVAQLPRGRHQGMGGTSNHVSG